MDNDWADKRIEDLEEAYFGLAEVIVDSLKSLFAGDVNAAMLRLRNQARICMKGEAFDELMALAPKEAAKA